MTLGSSIVPFINMPGGTGYHGVGAQLDALGVPAVHTSDRQERRSNGLFDIVLCPSGTFGVELMVPVRNVSATYRDYMAQGYAVDETTVIYDDYGTPTCFRVRLGTTAVTLVIVLAPTSRALKDDRTPEAA